jgi:hypothetical protein
VEVEKGLDLGRREVRGRHCRFLAFLFSVLLRFRFGVKNFRAFYFLSLRSSVSQPQPMNLLYPNPTQTAREKSIYFRAVYFVI